MRLQSETWTVFFSLIPLILMGILMSLYFVRHHRKKIRKAVSLGQKLGHSTSKTKVGFFEGIRLREAEDTLEKWISKLTRKIDHTKRWRRLFGFGFSNALTKNYVRRDEATYALSAVQKRLATEERQHKRSRKKAREELHQSTKDLGQSLEAVGESFLGIISGICDFFGSGKFKDLVLLSPVIRAEIIAAEKAKKEIAQIRGETGPHPKELSQPEEKTPQAILERKLIIIGCYKRYKEELEKLLADNPELVKDLLDRFLAEFLEGEEPN